MRAKGADVSGFKRGDWGVPGGKRAPSWLKVNRWRRVVKVWDETGWSMREKDEGISRKGWHVRSQIATVSVCGTRRCERKCWSQKSIFLSNQRYGIHCSGFNRVLLFLFWWKNAQQKQISVVTLNWFGYFQGTRNADEREGSRSIFRTRMFHQWLFSEIVWDVCCRYVATITGILRIQSQTGMRFSGEVWSCWSWRGGMLPKDEQLVLKLPATVATSRPCLCWIERYRARGKCDEV